ncbi:MAG: monooxygenase [Paracoccaceae bacterium]|nr:MAG: monooxygenase [Alphaproteobacteria bacterium]GIX13693.1 MAG: monooxygenase [Paracoccaceae bacterium]
MRLVQFDFPYSGPFGEEMARAMEGLARSINEEPGFLWKIWTEDRASGRAGGIYAFTDDAAAQAYIAKHSARLAEFGITGIRALAFDVNETLSRINNMPG